MDEKIDHSIQRRVVCNAEDEGRESVLVADPAARNGSESGLHSRHWTTGVDMNEPAIKDGSS